MTNVENINNSIQLDPNFVYPMNRKEIGQLISQFKNPSNGQQKSREEIKEYISLIKKQYREDKRKLRDENKNQCGNKTIVDQTISTPNSNQLSTPMTTSSISTITKLNDSDQIKKSRKEMREQIRQFKKSSVVPKSRKEISDFIESIKTQLPNTNQVEKENIQVEQTTNKLNCHHHHHHGGRNHSNDGKKNLISENKTSVESVKPSDPIDPVSLKLGKLKSKKEMLLRKLSILEIKIDQLNQSGSTISTTL
ncbi:hypothetical protein ACTA71_010199 [Dictyostelium dimigraforme]